MIATKLREEFEVGAKLDQWLLFERVAVLLCIYVYYQVSIAYCRLVM